MIFRFQYDPNFNADVEVKIGLFKTFEKMHPNVETGVIVDSQLEKFKKAEGLFGTDMTVSTRNKKQSGNYNYNFMNSFLLV